LKGNRNGQDEGILEKKKKGRVEVHGFDFWIVEGVIVGWTCDY